MVTEKSPLLVYFSSVSGNTAHLVATLGLRSARIPLYRHQEALKVTEPFVLVTPTYGGGEAKGAVPKQVINFLNDEANRRWIRGVISAGNTNFGEAFCLAGDIVSHKCHVPHLYRCELRGTSDDVNRINEGIDQWWKRL